jgi:hypothetical protein
VITLGKFFLFAFILCEGIAALLDLLNPGHPIIPFMRDFGLVCLGAALTVGI